MILQPVTSNEWISTSKEQQVKSYASQYRIENYYHHHGEQLGFYKKVHINTEQKEGCSCNFTSQETNEFKFIW